MATNIVHDSANWDSLWVKEADTGLAAGAEASLPGGSLSGAIGKLFRKGHKVGIIVDTPRIGANGNYWVSIDTACLVRISSVSGTCTDGATVFITAGGLATLTAGTLDPIGYADQAKANTGDDLWLQLVPGATLPIHA